MGKMNEIIEYRIQAFKSGNWFFLYSHFFTLEYAQREIKEQRDLWPELKYRIVRMTGTVVEEEILQFSTFSD